MIHLIRISLISAVACALLAPNLNAQVTDTDNLVIATIAGDIELVRKLIDDGSELEQRLGGHTALTAAIEQRDAGIALVLLAAGADPNVLCCGAPRKTPLMLAVSSGNDELVKELIARGADVNPGIDDKTALMIAVERNDIETVSELIEAGVELNAVYEDETALSIAEQGNDIELISLLLAAGADPNALCCSTGSRTMLYDAVQQRDLELVRLLIGLGVNLDRGSMGGQTPLTWAAGNSPEISLALIEAGADMSLATDRGLTALALAVHFGEEHGAPLVNAMLERGVDVNALHCEGWQDDPPSRRPAAYARERANRATALSVATSVGNDWAIEALINAGADVTLAQCDGRTPLELAAENGHETAAQIVRAAIDARSEQ